MVAAPPSRHCLGPTRTPKGPWSMVHGAGSSGCHGNLRWYDSAPAARSHLGSSLGVRNCHMSHMSFVMPLSQQENHGPKSRDSRYMSIFYFSFPSVLPSTPCFSCTQATRDGSIQSRWSWNGQLNLLLAQLSDDGMISTHEGILVDQLEIS